MCVCIYSLLCIDTCGVVASIPSARRLHIRPTRDTYL